jgi:hypothetical protein
MNVNPGAYSGRPNQVKGSKGCTLGGVPRDRALGAVRGPGPTAQNSVRSLVPPLEGNGLVARLASQTVIGRRYLHLTEPRFGRLTAGA